VTYKRKKRDFEGSPVTATDLKTLQRIRAKYGAKSFDAACRAIKILPARGPGRGKHYAGNLASVLIAVDEIAKDKGGVERAFDVLKGKIPGPSGKFYSRGGLKSVYYAAAALAKSNAEFADAVRQFKEVRANPELAIVIGGPIPPGLTKGATTPLIMKFKKVTS
jgi:hypothetical protein